MDLGVPTIIQCGLHLTYMNSSVLPKSDRYVTLALSEQSKFLKCGSKVNGFPMYCNVFKRNWIYELAKNTLVSFF